MRSENNLAAIIKQMAKAAVEESDPTSVIYGTIEEADAETGEVASVRIDQQWIADGEQVIVPHSYKERTIEKVKIKGNCLAQLRACLAKLEIAYELDEGCAEDEALVDVTIKDFLKAGDKVAMVRKQGGQQLVISGRTATSE